MNGPSYSGAPASRFPGLLEGGALLPVLGAQPVPLHQRGAALEGFPKDSELASLPAARVRLLGKPFTFETLQRVIGELLSEAP